MSCSMRRSEEPSTWRSAPAILTPAARIGAPSTGTWSATCAKGDRSGPTGISFTPMARSISDATGLAAGLPGEARTHLAPQSLRHKLRPKMRLLGAGMALIVVSSGIVVGCSGGAVTPAEPFLTQAGPTRTPPPTATPVTTPTEEPGADNLHPGLPLASASNAWFATSGVCSPCHTGMEDDSGTDVSIDTAWRASMMGNAARDPFWLATVRREVEANPESRTDLEANCTVCHMPMASVSAGLAGETPRILGDGLGDPQNELYDLAMDGVSCSLCHQIQAGNLGSASSYNGGFELDTTSIMGGRLIYGPYTVEDDLSDNMQSASGFIPIQALHVAQAEVCAPCHTAYAPPNPAATGSVALDASYFEWFYSDYRGERRDASRVPRIRRRLGRDRLGRGIRGRYPADGGASRVRDGQPDIGGCAPIGESPHGGYRHRVDDRPQVSYGVPLAPGVVAPCGPRFGRAGGVRVRGSDTRRGDRWRRQRRGSRKDRASL